ncbi:MAG: beta-lactamase family protein [Actinobacteria bacterium]|nr:beta-lactamase family protein [Actinomycetota bacterium]
MNLAGKIDRHIGFWTGVVAIMACAALALAGCSDDQPNTSSSTSLVKPGRDTEQPSVSTTAQGTVPSNGGYRSAITDTVVENPAFAALDADITDRITKAQLPGSSLLVLQKGRLVHQQAYGSYDLTTRVPIASASKWLSGVVIMSLVEEGLIDLDKPIGTYLAEAKGKPSAAITMRQLVGFTSGLEYDERIPCYKDPAVTLAECNATILGLPLIGKPGTGYRYGGVHLHVAAGVVEAVTQKTFEQVFQERVAEPLKMSMTTFTARQNGGASDGHPAPAGSAVSTLTDYGRFIEMLVHDGMAPSGERILQSASVREMSKDQTGDARFVSAAPSRKKAETPYGVAHWLDVVDSHDIGLVESSPGAFGFRPWIDRVNDIAGVYLILDTDDSHIEDSPDKQPGTPSVQTSGNFILVGAAKALGGKVPSPRRR